MIKNKFAEARKFMWKTLKKDDGLWISYRANIAMKLYDSKANFGDIKTCNEMADKLIDMIFGS